MKQTAALAVLAGMAVAVAALAAGLPPDTFFVGDPGVKLVVARQAIANPSRPLEVPLPVIGTEAVPYVDPFFSVHGDHAHAITSELFPLASAPIIAWFGLRGAYVLPAVGFLLAIWGCGRLGTALDERRNQALIVAVAALGTPWLFYGLEFWEHTCAVGVAAFGTAFFARQPATAALPFGMLMGAAALLRPEALWWAVAVLGCSRLLPAPPPPREVVRAACGFVLPWLPALAYTLVHFQTLATPHLAVNLGGSTARWAPDELALAWLFDWSRASLWRVAPALLLALTPLRRAIQRDGRWFLLSTAFIDVVLVTLTAPNDGGGQWGPRYLLFACVPLAVLAADALEAVARVRVSGVVVVALVLTGSGWIQRTAYRELRGTKRIYQNVLHLVRSEVETDGIAVTDVWWLDQIAAAATGDRQILYAADAATAAAVMKRLDAAGTPAITAFRDAGSSSRSSSETVAAWIGSMCYVEDRRRELAEPTLLAVRLRRTCGAQVGSGSSLP
jgi:hypothetical protein